MSHSRVSRNHKKRRSRDTRRRSGRLPNAAGLGLAGSLVGVAALSQGSELVQQHHHDNHSGQGDEISSPMMFGGKRHGGQVHDSDEYIVRFLEMLNTIKIYHWSTLSYPTHKATDKLHENMSGLVDSFIEKYIAITGTPVFHGRGNIPFCECKTTEDYRKKLQDYKKFMVSLTKILNGATELLNIRDEMIGEIDQAFYLLRLT